MASVLTKCPNCGGLLTVDDTKDAAICSCCGSPFVVEKAIREYNGSNGNTVSAASKKQDFTVHGGVLEKYTGNDGNVEIPADMNIKKIGYLAFKDCICVETVKIPDGVTEIGKYAFSGCKYLKNVSFSDTVSILGEYAFSDCEQLTDIVIPSTVTEMGAGVFNKCENLKTAKILAECDTLPGSMFSGCTKLETVVLSESIKTIGCHSFQNCSSLRLISDGFTIPDNINKLTRNYTHALVVSKSITKFVSLALDGVFTDKTKNAAFILSNRCEMSRGSIPNADVTLYFNGSTAANLNRFIDDCVKAYNGSHKYESVSTKDVTSYYFNCTSGFLDPQTLNNEYIAFFDLYKYNKNKIRILSISTELNKIKNEEEREKAAEKKKAEEERLYLQKKAWEEQGLCTNCGGEYVKKLFSYKCSKCGQKKPK